MSLYTEVGGFDRILALCKACHARLQQDPLAWHPFEHGTTRCTVSAWQPTSRRRSVVRRSTRPATETRAQCCVSPPDTASTRSVFAVASVAALYLNVFVLVVQLFAKTPALKELAPTQSEPPFAITQILVLALFAWIGRAAVSGLRRTTDIRSTRRSPGVPA